LQRLHQSLPPNTQEHATVHEANRESFSFPTPGLHRLLEADAPLTAILRQGDQRLLRPAIEAKVEQWIADLTQVTDERGHRQVVRNRRSPGRTLTTGVGRWRSASPACMSVAMLPGPKASGRVHVEIVPGSAGWVRVEAIDSGRRDVAGTPG
jgi:hypothetical protein